MAAACASTRAMSPLRARARRGPARPASQRARRCRRSSTTEGGMLRRSSIRRRVDSSLAVAAQPGDRFVGAPPVASAGGPGADGYLHRRASTSACQLLPGSLRPSLIGTRILFIGCLRVRFTMRSSRCRAEMHEAEGASRDPSPEAAAGRTARARGRARGESARPDASGRPHPLRDYHVVPPQRAEAFDQQVRWFAERYDRRPEGSVRAARRSWPHRRPGMLHLLRRRLPQPRRSRGAAAREDAGRGWFSVPSAFCDVPEPEQRPGRASTRSARWVRRRSAPRVTWDQVRALDLRHVVVSHTRDHGAAADALGAERIREQVFAGKRALEAQLGHECRRSPGSAARISRTAPRARARSTRPLPRRLGTNNRVVRRATTPAHRAHQSRGELPAGAAALPDPGALDWLYAPKRRRLARRLTPA